MPFTDAWISAEAYFNLGLEEEGAPLVVSKYSDSTLLSSIPVASELVLSRVLSSVTNSRDTYEESLLCLKSHFKKSLRLVQEGDILSVDINVTTINLRKLVGTKDNEDVTDEELASETGDGSRLTAYFKVSGVKGPEKSSAIRFKIDPNTTRVILGGATTSKIPQVQVQCYKGVQSQPLLFSLSAEARHLTQLVLQYLSPMSLGVSSASTVLLHGVDGVGKGYLAASVARSLGVHIHEVDCQYTEFEMVEAQVKEAIKSTPAILLLKNVNALKENSESSLHKLINQWCESSFNDNSSFVAIPMIVATSDDPEKLSNVVRSLFRYEIVCQSPSRHYRKRILKSILLKDELAADIDLDHIAEQTAGLIARDLLALVSRAKSFAIENILLSSPVNIQETDVICAGVTLTSQAFDRAINYSKSAHSDSIGAPKIPSVTWDDIGGLSHIKASIVETMQLPLERPDLFENGIKKRSGILLFGPPGTGKTLVAKAVATTFSLNFLSVKGPELLNMYIGESEANVRRIFQRARDAKPCVIFFDELDSIAPKRGEKGDSGGVMDRIVSQLLAELDSVGSGSGGDVFVIGATNRPDLLDPALLRPGRFDKLLYLGVSDDKKKQLSILKALTRKFNLDPSLSLDEVASACQSNFTGADFYALCSDAMLNAVNRLVQTIDNDFAHFRKSELKNQSIPLAEYLENNFPKDAQVVTVTMADFLKAIQELKPSVSLEDLEHYKK
ncbi:peroxisomal assembly protein, partial [Chytridiales sp. JEL 0842]